MSNDKLPCLQACGSAVQQVQRAAQTLDDCCCILLQNVLLQMTVSTSWVVTTHSLVQEFAGSVAAAGARWAMTSCLDCKLVGLSRSMCRLTGRCLCLPRHTLAEFAPANEKGCSLDDMTVGISLYHGDAGLLRAGLAVHQTQHQGLAHGAYCLIPL